MRFCQRGQNIGNGVGLHAPVIGEVNRIRALFSQPRMAGLQPIRGQSGIFHVKAVVTAQKLHAKFLRGAFNFTQSNASSA